MCTCVDGIMDGMKPALPRSFRHVSECMRLGLRLLAAVAALPRPTAIRAGTAMSTRTNPTSGAGVKTAASLTRTVRDAAHTPRRATSMRRRMLLR